MIWGWIVGAVVVVAVIIIACKMANKKPTYAGSSRTQDFLDACCRHK